MISNSILQETLEGIKSITQVDLIVKEGLLRERLMMQSLNMMMQ